MKASHLTSSSSHGSTRVYGPPRLDVSHQLLRVVEFNNPSRGLNRRDFKCGPAMTESTRLTSSGCFLARRR